jgi:membrane-associated phospholipid phosphatase
VSHGLYALIVGVDRPSNSLPSLHAGLALYSLLFAWRVGAGELSCRTRLLCGLAGALWGSLILYSTLATKQHWVVDLPAGMLLALAAHALAWRGVGEESAAASEATTSTRRPRRWPVSD